MLASVCPRALIEEVLADTGKASQRERLLPAPAVVYYVMALALWREVPLEEVLRVVCEGLQWLGGGEAGAVQASKSAISQARTRLGSRVMRQLAERVLRPLAALGAPGAWYRGLRVVALDGSYMGVADEAANAEFFGYPGASRGQSKASSTSSRRTGAPTARCCAARCPIWCYKSCGGCCWRTSLSAS